MQHQEQTTNGVSYIPTTRSAHASRPSLGGDLTGFSHGAFSSNQPTAGGFADRNPQRMNIPTINTTRLGQVGQSVNDLQTPGTAFDMNFTPLLPSQLLLGSPFQPGSPTTFASPQFQSFPNFTPQSHASQQRNHQNHMSSPQQQQPMSPQMYSNMMSPTSMGNNAFYGGMQSPGGSGMIGGNYGNSMSLAPGLMSNTSRTVYLGNIPADTSAEEILGHVRSGQIESVRLLPDKSCAFISFLDGSSATHFHSDAILKKLSIRGQDIKIGWGKPSQVPTSVALAVQQSGASRNVYLGNLPAEITEEEIREDLGKFGAIDTIKLVREKSIAFVHFLSIGNAIKAVTQLPQEPNWQPPRRVFYGKDRCAYVSKTQQQNAAQYLGIAPGYAHVLNSADRDLISNALAQQSVAAAAVATAAGGVNNLGNRTVYLGNIHPETTIEEICNVVRGGLLHHIRYIPDKHICFVTFIDPTSAASFYALSNMQGLMIHNRRLKIGWGKHSGALPPAIALAVSGGASRNVYVGNLDETWSEERLRQDFAEYGDIELINTLREKSCAFVNFTNIANAIKAIEGVRGNEEYKRFKINFGKDRCGNAPRQINHNQNNQFSQNNLSVSQDGPGSPSPNGLQPSHSSQSGSAVSTQPTSSMSPPSTQNQLSNGIVHAPTPSTILNAGSNNPLTMFLNQMSAQNQQQQQQQREQQQQQREQQQQQVQQQQHHQVNQQHTQQSHHQPQQSYDLSSPVYEQRGHQQRNSMSTQRSTYLGGLGSESANAFSRQSSLEPPRQQNQYVPGHGPSNSFSVHPTSNGVSSTSIPTIGGLLAPSNMNSSQKAQHNRTISLPAFSQGPFGQSPQSNHSQNNGFGGLSSYIGSYGSSSSGNGGYGLAIQGDGALPGWAEEETTS